MIYDADRKPVSGAIVTLYREGQIVNRSNAGATANAYGGPALNPVISAYNHLEDSSSEGSYAFSGLYPGVYEVTVEKCSYNTSTLVDVNDSKAIYHGMIHMDIWIDGYHGPVWTQEQLSSTGAITGRVLDRNEHALQRSLVTLMRNGQPMDIPHNPRYIYFNGTYVFRYLLPGQYQVIAEEEGHTSLPVDVSVQNGTSYADIIIQGYDIDSFLSATPSLMTPVSTPAPTALPITPRPTPSAGIPAILLSMAASTSFIQKFRK